MEELRRRMSSAKAWGIEAELVSPDFVQEKVPFLDKDVIVGAFWTPSVGVVDSLRAGTIMRERAQEKGVLTVCSGVEVTGMEVVDGHIKAVETTGKRFITVEAGDTLGNLAAEHKIDGGWRTLWSLNKSTIADPNLIFVDQKIAIG